MQQIATVDKSRLREASKFNHGLPFFDRSYNFIMEFGMCRPYLDQGPWPYLSSWSVLKKQSGKKLFVPTGRQTNPQSQGNQH